MAEKLKSKMAEKVRNVNSLKAEHKAQCMQKLKRQKDEYLKKLKSKRAKRA